MEKQELEGRARAIVAELSGTKYDLVANIVHDSPPGQEMKEVKKGEEGAPGTFRVHVVNRVSGLGGEVASVYRRNDEWMDVASEGRLFLMDLVVDCCCCCCSSPPGIRSMV